VEDNELGSEEAEELASRVKVEGRARGFSRSGLACLNHPPFTARPFAVLALPRPAWACTNYNPIYFIK
jgi:hypothetical protein